MVAQIRTFLQNLTEVPEGIFPQSFYKPITRRAIKLGYYSYLTALLWHTLFIFIWLFLQVYLMTFIGVFAALFYITIYYLQRKGFFLTALFFAALTTFLYVCFAVLILGWSAGFQYNLILIPILIFATVFEVWAKIAMTFANLLAYFGLYMISYFTQPFVDMESIFLQFFYQFNIVSISLMLAFLSHVNFKMAKKNDKKLYKENKRTKAALKERDQVLEQLNNELNEAADYVKKILPQPITEGVIRTNWRFIPSTSLGGDAFGYHNLDEDHFAIYLIDVSGHGVGAALLSASVINVLRSQSLPNTDFKDPDQVLRSLNFAFPSEANKDMFFTIWYGVFNRDNRELTYASAGHPPALLCDENSSCNCNINLLKTPNFVVGGIKEAAYVKDKCEIPEGNTLYIFSDGVYEVEKSDGTKWHFNEFVNYIKKVKSDGQAVMDRLYDHVRRKGKLETFEDDFTIVEVVFG